MKRRLATLALAGAFTLSGFACSGSVPEKAVPVGKVWVPESSTTTGAAYYRSCAEAPHELHRGEPGYRTALDRDGDGVACNGTSK